MKSWHEMTNAELIEIAESRAADRDAAPADKLAGILAQRLRGAYDDVNKLVEWRARAQGVTDVRAIVIALAESKHVTPARDLLEEIDRLAERIAVHVVHYERRVG